MKFEKHIDLYNAINQAGWQENTTDTVSRISWREKGRELINQAEKEYAALQQRIEDMQKTIEKQDIEIADRECAHIDVFNDYKNCKKQAKELEKENAELRAMLDKEVEQRR